LLVGSSRLLVNGLLLLCGLRCGLSSILSCGLNGILRLVLRLLRLGLG
jgi:hypothetical protein